MHMEVRKNFKFPKFSDYSDIGISVGINCLLFLASSPQSGTVKTKFNSLLKVNWKMNVYV